MHTRSFNKIISIAVLFIFLATPSLALAQLNSSQATELALLLGLQRNGTISSQQLVTLGLLQQIQNQQQNQNFGQQQGGNQSPFGGAGSNPMLMAGLLGGGLGGNQAGGQGGGGGGQIGQMLMMAGLLSGNMGLMMAGLLTSMLGGLSGAGGQGNTPQQGRVDEQYVAPGQAGPYGQGGGYGANSPYYTTPTPNPASPTPTPAATACSQSIFIAKDTTANPVTTKPYPASLTIPQADCALVVNTDSADHSLGGNSVAKQSAQIFRFATKKVYNMCIDASTTACTAVTVQ